MIPKEATGKGTSTIRWGLDSMFLVIDEESENALLGNYKGHGLLGYDSETKQYSLSMYNNFGDHPTYTGSFSGDTLLLKTTVPTPDGTFDQELLWYRDGENIHLQVLNDLGKGFKLAVDQVAAPFIARIKRGK